GHDGLGRLAYSNNACFADFDEEGRLVFMLDSPEGLEAFRFWKELVDLKVIAFGGENLTQFINGQAAMDLGFALWHLLYPYQDMQDEIGLVPVPMGPSADDYVFAPRDGEGFVLPANSENPLGLIALVN